jgi:hypothetical protein
LKLLTWTEIGTEPDGIAVPLRGERMAIAGEGGAEKAHPAETARIAAARRRVRMAG